MQKTIEVSTNKGLTWEVRNVNIKELELEKSDLKIGEWVSLDGKLYVVKELDKKSSIYEHYKEGTKLISASAITEYNVGNRGFESYEDAYAYCKNCDLDLELNLEVN